MHKSDEYKDILNESRLIERVKRILEGDVISFADYKRRKQGDNVISQAQDNILKDLDNSEYNQPEEIEVESDPMTASYIRDYRKNPQDVQVGDILVCSWGYSMNLVDYYRVTERKVKSIRLEKLQTKILTGSGYQGTCIPSDEVAPERQQEYVKNKLFRIGVKWSNDVVCRINDHSVYFWDGKPDSYDYMD